MTNPQEAEVVLITGAARRVGAAIARRLHAEGANVAIHYNHSQTNADALAAELNSSRKGSAAGFRADLTDTDHLPALIDKVIETFGRLDGLVNNASSFYTTPMGKITAQQWADLMGTNVKAPLFLTQAAVPHLRETHGAVVNVVDIHADRPLKDFLVYSVAKSALGGLTRALAIELGPDIRVNGVAPGAILWPDESDMFPHAERQRILSQVPLAREGSPEDIADAVEFLMFGAPYVNGQIIAVDGGRSVFL